MQAFEQLNKREKFTNFCFYVFIALLPIIGLISISTYAFIYLKEDLDFVSKELDGLHVITQVQESAFKYQRLRGLSSIASCECQDSNKKIFNDIIKLKQEISQDLLTLTKRIRSKQSSTLQKELLNYLEALDPHNGPTDFESLSKTIYQLLYFSSKISYECNLKLESHLESYIMADNVVSLLPNIIEYNGQIRAVSSAIQNKRLTQEQQEHIHMQLSKLQDHLDLLRFHYSILSSFHVYAQLEKNYQNMLDAQDEIIHIVRNRLLHKESVEINGLNIYLLITNNIDLIIELYRSNAKYLQKELQEKYDGT
ncbi:MAG: hypothetical protein RBR54_09310, partial [Sulfurimonas sp.]|nr:hypothetical protein [Sulfurimonas sp.]